MHHSTTTATIRPVAMAVGAALAVLAGATPAVAQQAGGRFAGEATVNVVEVPVRVFDPDTGEPVSGLGPEDFVILENGVLQAVTNFTEVVRGVAAGRPTEPEQRLPASIVPSVPRHDRPPPLQMVYLLDLYLMTPSERDRAVDGITARYATGVPRDEQVSVVVFDGRLETFADRSEDHRELLAALAEIRRRRARGHEQQISFTPGLAEASIPDERNPAYYERRQRSREFVFELEKRVRRVGDALSATMARYGRADGRRVLVAMTPGHPRHDWTPSYGSIDFLNNAAAYPQAAMWRELALEAADLGFTLFVLDSSGVAARGSQDVSLGATDSLDDVLRQSSISQGGAARANPDSFAQNPDTAGADPNEELGNLGQWLERTRKNLLVDAAEATGGTTQFAFDFERAIDSVRSDLDHYYSLAYAAGHAGDGNEYEIEVRVPGHPGARVVHRRAYVDQPPAVRSAQRLRSEMLFGGDANPLGVRVELGEPEGRFRLGAAGSKRVRIPVDVKIPFARLEMVPRGGVHWGRVLITFFNQDAAGNQSRLASEEQEITVDSDRYEEAVAKGYFRYSTVLEIEGGAQSVYVGIQDQLSNRTSIMPQKLKF